MINTKLYESKNATVAAYLNSYDIGGFDTREEMLTGLCENLLSQITLREEQEALDKPNQIKGTYVLHMPVQYMVENAKPKDVTVYNLLKEQLTKINKGETAAMILPALTDENGNRMFTLEYVGPQKI